MKTNIINRVSANLPETGKEFAGKAQMPEVLRGRGTKR